MEVDIAVVGGGAAGFFGAIAAAEIRPDLKIAIFEKGKDFLQKVRISGGGRCNVTHACFDPSELVEFYPRGKKELLGPFHKFAPGDTIQWFEDRGVALKVESDNRMFPVSNDSASIVNCLIDQTNKFGIRLHTGMALQSMEIQEENFLLRFMPDKAVSAKKVLFTTGSSPSMWKLLKGLGIKIKDPVPSLFTFNIRNDLIKGLQGISVPKGILKIPELSLESEGPLLITHWGLSGPAVLRLSAWGARELFHLNHHFALEVNWTGADPEVLMETIQNLRMEKGFRQVGKIPPASLPARLWSSILHSIQVPENKKWADLTKQEIDSIVQQCTRCALPVGGKSTFKDEFVTAGGVELEEINFKHFQCRKYPSLFFAGEVLDIDAITGGFNFQAAWTGGFLAGRAMAESV